MQSITELWITDKTNKRYWRVTCNPDYADAERRNLGRHMELIRQGNPAYHFIDRATAKIEEQTRTIGA